jgi:hypothetical protein
MALERRVDIVARHGGGDAVEIGGGQMKSSRLCRKRRERPWQDKPRRHAPRPRGAALPFQMDVMQPGLGPPYS